MNLWVDQEFNFVCELKAPIMQFFPMIRIEKVLSSAPMNGKEADKFAR